MATYDQHGGYNPQYPPQYGYGQPGYDGYGQGYPPPNPYHNYPPPQQYPPTQYSQSHPPAQPYPSERPSNGPPSHQNGSVVPAYQTSPTPKPHGESPEELAGKKSERFVPTGKWQDLWALVLFYLHLAAVIALAILYLPGITFTNMTGRTRPPTGPNGIQLQAISSRDIVRHVIALAAGVAVSLIGTIMYMTLLRKHPISVVKFSFFASIALFVALGIMQIVMKSYVAGVLMFIAALFFIISYRTFKKRMGLVACMIQTVLDVANKYRGTFVTSILALLISVVHSVLALLVMLAAWQKHYNFQTGPAEGRLIAITLYLSFSMYWSQETIRNTAHVTLSGVFASFYFLSPAIRTGPSSSNGTSGQTPGMPSNPVLKSAKRALTTSFGSVAFGSLLVAILQLIRQLVRHMRDQSDNSVAAILAIALDCILGCVEGLIEFFNEYAFTQVAIYGKPYVRAAKDTMNLFKIRGLDMVVTENLTGSVTFVGGFFSGGIGALATFLAGLALNLKFFDSSKETNPEWAWVILLLVVALVMGFIIFGVGGVVIDSGVTTTFVCLAEEPEALWRTKPELFDRIREMWPEIILPV